MRDDENLSIKGKSLSPLPDNKSKINLNKLLNKLQKKSLKLVRNVELKKNYQKKEC